MTNPIVFDDGVDTGIDFTPAVDRTRPQVPSGVASGQAYMATAISGTSAPKNIFDTIKYEYETYGQSDTEQDILRTFASDRQTAIASAVESIITDPSVEPELRAQVLDDYMTNRRIADKALPEAYAEHLVDEELIQRTDKKPDELAPLLDVNEWRAAESERKKLINQFVAKGSTDALTLAAGVASMITPFMEQRIVEGFKEESSFLDYLLMGSSKKELKKALRKMPPQERLEATRNILELASKLPASDVHQILTVQSLLDDGEYGDVEMVIDNVVGVLDASLIGGVVGRSAKSLFRAWSHAPIDAAHALSDTTARRMVEESFDNPELAEAITLGGDAAEVAARSLSGEAPIPSRSVSADTILEQTRTAGYATDVWDKTIQELRLFDDLASKESLEATDFISFARDGEEIKGTVLYADGMGRFFTTAEEGIRAFRAAGHDPDTIRWFTKEGGVYRELDGVPTDTGRYYAGYDFNHVYNAEDVFVYGADATTKLSRFPVFGSWLVDVVSGYDSNISSSLLRSETMKTAIEEQVLREANAAWRKTLPGTKAKVIKALEEGAIPVEAGSKHGQVWEESVLRNRFGLSTNGVKAYYAFRRASDTNYKLYNREYYKKLSDGEFLAISNADELTGLYGKKVSELPTDIHAVWDVAAGAVRGVDESLDASEMYVKLSKPYRTAAGHKVDYALINHTAGSKLSTLPTEVLPYIRGYIHRTYKDHWFVDVIPKNLKVNGRSVSALSDAAIEHKVTKKAYRSQAEAEAAVEALRASGEYGRVLEARLGREYSKEAYDAFEMQLSGMPSAVQGRGEMISTRIEDPYESLLRVTRTIANRVGYGRTMDVLTKKWENTFKQSYPRTIDEINTTDMKPVDINAARALWKLIADQQNLPGMTDSYLSRMLINVAELIDSKGLKGLSDVIRDNSQIRLSSALRSVPTTMFIVFRPLTQLVVQPSQLLQLAFVDPLNVPKNISQTMGALLGMAAYGRTSQAGRATELVAAKMSGMTLNEFRVFIDAYRNKSGMPFSVDAHMFVEGMSRSTNTGTTLGFTDAYRAVRNTSKVIGFDTGEMINLTGSWVFARNKWIRENPTKARDWMKKENLDAITASASKISYAMTAPGKFGYQKGFPGVALQFVAVPHKALLSMTTSKAWTKQEKLKLALGNTVMFGAVGVGIDRWVQDVIETSASEGYVVDDDTKIAIRGGFLDWSFNNILHTITGEQSDIQFSAKFSPISEGIAPGFMFFEAMLDGETWKAFGGPLYHLWPGNERSRTSLLMGELAAIHAMPELDTTSKLLKYMDTSAQLASGWNDWMQFRYADKMGTLITSTGKDTGVHSTWARKYAQLFGFQTYEEAAIYRTSKKLRESEVEITDHARSVVDSMLRVVTKNPDMAVTAWENFKRNYIVTKMTLDPDEFSTFSRELQNLMTRESKPMTELLEKAIMERGFKASGDLVNDLQGWVEGSNLSPQAKEVFRDSVHMVGNK